MLVSKSRWLEMAPKLQRVVRKPPLSLEAIKETLIHENPSLADPLKRKGCQYSCMELFGQPCSLKSGFIAYGMDAESFDVRTLSCSRKN